MPYECRHLRGELAQEKNTMSALQDGQHCPVRIRVATCSSRFTDWRLSSSEAAAMASCCAPRLPSASTAAFRYRTRTHSAVAEYQLLQRRR